MAFIDLYLVEQVAFSSMIFAFSSSDIASIMGAMVIGSAHHGFANPCRYGLDRYRSCLRYPFETHTHCMGLAGKFLALT